jgi:hypothetical protein
LPDAFLKLHKSAILGYLSNLATWLNKPETYAICKKIIEKADEFVVDSKDVLDLHYHWQNRLMIYYRNRETDPAAMDKAIESCEKQIQIADDAIVAFRKEFGTSLPMHKGFEQLSIIMEKQGHYEGVISICQKALQQGWAGTWEKRIAKAKKKIVG